MKHLLIIAAVIVLAVLSCKKKNDPPPATSPTSTTGSSTTGGTTTGGTSTTPTTSATKFHGIFSIFTSTTVFNGTPTISQFSEAFFTGTPVQSPDTGGINVKRVSFNGDTLWFGFPSPKRYTKFSKSISSAAKFEVIGANGIPSFTYDATFSEPGCTNLNSIPSVVSKSQGFTFTLNVSNAKFAELEFKDDGHAPIIFPLSNGSNTITLVPAQLNSLNVTVNGSIAVQLENSSAHMIGGKDFLFTKNQFFKISVEIKN